jgi:hypothetical protein
MRIVPTPIAAAFVLGLAAPIAVRADAPGDSAAVKQDDSGTWVDKDGDPTSMGPLLGGRPEKQAPKPAAWTKNEDQCMGSG